MNDFFVKTKTKQKVCNEVFNSGKKKKSKKKKKEVCDVFLPVHFHIN